MVTPLQEQEGMSSSKKLSCWCYENVAFYYWACISAVREVWLRHNARYTIPSRGSSVHFTVCTVMSDSLQPQGLQHARIPCPSPTPRACSNSRPSSWWYHPTISSSVNPFSSRPQSFPASESFPVSQFFASGGQSIRASASASVLQMNIHGWFPLEWTGLVSLQSKGLPRGFSNTTVQINSSTLSLLYGPTLTSVYNYWEKQMFNLSLSRLLVYRKRSTMYRWTG